MNAAVALESESRAARRQWHVAVAGGMLLGLGALALGTESWRRSALLLIRALVGASLYHAAFGFTSAYRRAIVERDVAAVLAQLVMLGLATLLFAPLPMAGEGHHRGRAHRRGPRRPLRAELAGAVAFAPGRDPGRAPHGL